MRTMLVVLAVGLAMGPVRAGKGAVAVGDDVAILMKGDLAKEYVRLLGSGLSTDALEINVSARIVQRLEDGRLGIEHALLPRVAEGEPQRLVTLSGTVDESALRIQVTPKGTPTSTAPGAPPMPTANESRAVTLELTDLAGLKLRAWSLSEEVGETSVNPAAKQ